MTTIAYDGICLAVDRRQTVRTSIEAACGACGHESDVRYREISKMTFVGVDVPDPKKRPLLKIDKIEKTIYAFVTGGSVELYSYLVETVYKFPAAWFDVIAQIYKKYPTNELASIVFIADDFDVVVLSVSGSRVTLERAVPGKAWGSGRKYAEMGMREYGMTAIQSIGFASVFDKGTSAESDYIMRRHCGLMLEPKRSSLRQRKHDVTDFMTSRKRNL